MTVVWWYLCHGKLIERGRQDLADFAARTGVEVIDAGHLGPDPALVPLLTARYEEALAGRVEVNCDTCAYRAPWPGREDRVGQAIGVGHSHLAVSHRHPHPRGTGPRRPPITNCRDQRTAGVLREGAGAGGQTALGPLGHVRQGEGVQVPAHVLADVSPHGEQHTLALVIAGPVLVRLAEIPGHDRALTALTIWLRVMSAGERAST